MADKDPNEKTIEEDLVVTKYKMAGELVNRVLKKVIDKCVNGANIREICEFGDSQLLQETANVFRKEKQMKKGIAFPTSLSVNNCICHFSPTAADPDVILRDNDVVKVDLGAHIDGFIAVVAHTVVVGASANNKVKGRAADALVAAYYASEAALRLLKPGNETYAVTDIVQKVSESFKCKPVEGMLSHQLKQFKIDGEKTIIQNPNESQKKEHEKFEFEVNEVYAMDVIISTGEGMGRDTGARVKIYKKTDEVYQLKLKASRAFFKDVVQKHGNMPFNLRSFDDENKARLGAGECVNHKLIDAFQILYEKNGEFVAQFKFTVLLMPSGTHRITGLPFEKELYESTHEITDPDVKAILGQSAHPKSAKRKKKKSEKAVSEVLAGQLEAEPMEVDS